jgi:tRNA(Ile)-lysidine synthase
MREVRKNVVLQRENTAIELARDKLLGYDPEIRARVLRTVLRGLESVPDKSATDALLRFVETAESGRRFDVTRGVRAERAYNIIRLTREQPEEGDEVVEIAACNEGRGVAAVGGCRWSVQWTTSQTERRAGAEAAAFDCRTLRFPLTIRAWLPGDRIRMPYGTKKLKKLFAEHRVPFHVRSTIPVIAEANGRVLWVPKIARSTEAMVDDENSALTITVSNAENS